MFGEEELKGIKQLKLARGQITLPDFTRVEPSEVLYFFKLNNEIRLYNEKNLLNLTKLLIENYATNHTLYESRRFHRAIYSLSIIDKKVSKDKKITIPQELIDKHKYKKEVVVIGADTHLKIFKDMESYKEYLKSQKV